MGTQLQNQGTYSRSYFPRQRSCKAKVHVYYSFPVYNLKSTDGRSWSGADLRRLCFPNVHFEMLLPIAHLDDAFGFDADFGPNLFFQPIPYCYSLRWVKVAAFVARSRADRPLRVTLPDGAGRQRHGIHDSTLVVGMREIGSGNKF